MTLLSVIQKAAKRTTLFDSPSIVFSNNETAISQAQELLFEVGEELKKDYDWQFRIKEQVFNTVDTQNAYALDTIVTDGDWDSFIGDTMYDRTNNRWLQVVDTPLWQAFQSVIGASAGITKAITIFNDAINIYPTPTSVDTLVFNYKSSNWIKDSGGTPIADFTADSNVFFFNEEMLTLGLIYKLRQAYGVPYEDNLLAFTKRASAEAQNNRIPQTISKPVNVIRPFANIPDTGFGV